jgi:tetratricopeptide (TPR) repeat protein
MILPRGARASRGLQALLRAPATLSLAVFLLAVLAHLTVLGNDFVYDDLPELDANPVIQAPFDLRAILSAEYMAGFQGRTHTGHYRPLLLLVQKIEFDLFGRDPLPFHLTVVLLHGVLSALIAEFLRRRCGLGAGAFLAGALFAVHPALTEAGVCSYSLKEVLAGLFSFGALFVYSGWREERPYDRALRLTLSSLLLVAGLLGKESCALFFLALPAWDLLHGAPSRGIREIARRSLRPALLHAGLFASALFAGLSFRALVLGGIFVAPPGSPINNPLLQLEGFARVPTALRIAWIHLRVLVLPLWLSHDYSADSIPLARSFLEPGVIAGAIVLLGLVTLLLRAPRLLPPAGVGAVITAATYALTSNFFLAIGTIFSERFLYLPCVGLSLVIAPYLERAMDLLRTRGRAARAAALGVPALVLATFSVLALIRTDVFSDEKAMVRDALGHYPRNLAMQNQMVDLQATGGSFQKAEALLEEIERRRPDFPFLVEHKAMLAAARGRRAEALQLYLEATRSSEADIMTFRACAEQLVGAGREPEAIRVLSAGLRDPHGDYRERARARELRGVLLLGAGRMPQALVDLRVACLTHPALPGAWGDLGKGLTMAGSIDQAMAAYERALALQPWQRDYVLSLALLHAGRREFAQAIALYRGLLEREPENLTARDSLGGCLISMGDYDGARTLFTEVLRRAPNDRYALASLGSLDAASGNLIHARSRYERFLSLPQPDDDLTRKVRAQMERLRGP